MSKVTKKNIIRETSRAKREVELAVATVKRDRIIADANAEFKKVQVKVKADEKVDLKRLGESGFHCKRNASVNVHDLESQISGQTPVYLMMFPHTCCACGKPCQQYIKFHMNEETKRWVIGDSKDNCVIGTCCFNTETHKIEGY